MPQRRSPHRSPRRSGRRSGGRVGVAMLVAAAALGVAGCGADPPASPASTSSSRPAGSGSPTSSTGAPSTGTPSTGTPSTGTPGTGTSSSTRYPTYVALGDSYTAAPGVPTTEQDDGCLRSDGNYPARVEGGLGGSLVDVSCSGATTTSLIGVQQTSKQALPPQFDALQPTTSLVTLGVGANDLGFFQTVVTGCLRLGAGTVGGHPCRDYARANGKHGGDLFQQDIREIGGLVEAALAGIRDRSPDATIVLVGYPQPVPAQGTCPDLLPLAADDYAYVRGLFADLGTAMQDAARKADVHYVDLVRASQGHDICAGDAAWVNGITTDVERALALHPFAEEQQAVADLVDRAIGPA